MTEKASSADCAGSPKQAVDYYYLEAMRYLSCSDHHSDDSDPDHTCNCRRCRGEDDSFSGEKDHRSSHDSFGSYDEEFIDGRQRSWSHSMANDFESEEISQLPKIEGKMTRGMLGNRRYSTGMLNKPDIKLTNGHVQWADECKKELTRCRPRKKYLRHPTLKPPPMKSILKHSSDESLVVNEDSSSD